MKTNDGSPVSQSMPLMTLAAAQTMFAGLHPRKQRSFRDQWRRLKSQTVVQETANAIHAVPAVIAAAKSRVAALVLATTVTTATAAAATIAMVTTREMVLTKRATTTKATSQSYPQNRSNWKP